MKSIITLNTFLFPLIVLTFSGCFFTYQPPSNTTSSLCYNLNNDCFDYNRGSYNLSNCTNTPKQTIATNIQIVLASFSQTLEKPDPSYLIQMGGLNLFFLKTTPKTTFRTEISSDILIAKTLSINSNSVNAFSSSFWLTKNIPEANTSGIDFIELKDFCIEEQNGVLLNFPLNTKHSIFRL